MIGIPFENPVFRAGELNTTVRMGDGWAKRFELKDGEDVALHHAVHDELIAVGKAVLEFARVKVIGDITPEEFSAQHDPRCRDLDGLCRVLEEYYPDSYIGLGTTVTVIGFIPYYSETIHGAPADELERASIAEHNRRLDQAVESGKISEEQASEQIKVDWSAAERQGMKAFAADSRTTLSERDILEKFKNAAQAGQPGGLLQLIEQVQKEQREKARPRTAKELAEMAVACVHEAKHMASAAKMAEITGQKTDLAALAHTVQALQLSQMVLETGASIVAAIDRLTAAFQGAANA